jgi:molybdopterin synthase catalytic subunit
MFVGTVRDKSAAGQGDGLQHMALEHYPGMTERAIEAMVAQAIERFGIFEATVIHRVGELKPCEQIVLVAVSSAHRHKSFEACEFLMDYLKTQAPFWKRESRVLGDGSLASHWVDAREADDAALRRWGIVAHNA